MQRNGHRASAARRPLARIRALIALVSVPVMMVMAGSATAKTVACPSTSQCTELKAGPGPVVEATFTPSTGTTNAAGFKTLASAQTGAVAAHRAVACPSNTQCTAVNGNRAVTFNPATGTVNAAGVKPVITLNGQGINGYELGLQSVSCPSTTQCTAITSSREVTFNPATGTVNAAGPKEVIPSDSASLTALACPMTDQCTAVDGASDREVTFDPTSGAVNAAGVKHLNSSDGIVAVACSSSTQCTASAYDGAEVTFDPASGTVNPAGTKQVGADSGLLDLECPSDSECTGVGSGPGGKSGTEVTFNPATGSATGPGIKTIDGGTVAISVSCATAAQCTALDRAGNEATYDPATGAATSFRRIKAPGTGTAHVGSVKTSGATARVPVSCARGGSSCALTLQITVTEKLRKHRKKVVVLGKARVTIAAGKKKTVKVSLNGAGKRLLAKHKHLKTKLKVTSRTAGGKTRTVANKTVTFKQPKKHKKKK